MGTSRFRQSDLPFPLLRGRHPSIAAGAAYLLRCPSTQGRPHQETPSQSHLLSLIPLPISFTLHRLTHTRPHHTTTHTYTQILILILVVVCACCYTAYRVHLPISYYFKPNLGEPAVHPSTAQAVHGAVCSVPSAHLQYTPC